MPKDPYKNARYYMDESIAATKKLLKDPYQGRQTVPGPKDPSKNEDKGSSPVKVGQGDIPPSSWLRGGGKGGESYANFNPTSRTSRDPATQGSGGRKKSSGK